MTVRTIGVVSALFLFCAALGGTVGQKKLSEKFGSDASVSGKPVTKVINLLKEMQAQITREGDEDQDTFDKQACWCETNDKEKTKSVAEAEHHTNDLTAHIEELTAKGAQLEIDIANIGEALAKGKKSLEEASAVRDKELADFNKDDKDAIMAIKGLHSAVVTLKKHGASMTQESLIQVRNVLSHHVHMDEGQLRTFGLAPMQKRFVASFLQESTVASLYTSDSGEIFGVLQAMKESFEANMATSRKEETRAADEFATMKAAKQDEITAASDQKEGKETELADTDEENANSKVDLKDTNAQLKADRVFHKDLKKQCSKMDKEWAARQKMRQDELSAISQALGILTDDDARDLVARTTNFFQASMQSSSERSSAQSKAARILQEAGKKFSRPRLSMLATRMRTMGFASVVADITAMIRQLNQEQKDEVKHKDYCVEELHQNEMDVDEKYHEQKNLATKEADLEASIKKTTEEITAANADVAETQIEMNKAANIREKESKEFTTIIADQRATMNLLNKVVAKLNEFYAKKASLVEEDDDDDDYSSQPDGLQAYSKNDGAKAQGWGVLAMIKAIVKESAKVVMETTINNNNSQLAYEEFAREANKSIKMLRQEIADKTNQIAKDHATLARVKADLAANMEDLEGLNELNQQIHVDCDFVVDNFEQRQNSRTNEVDALIEAKKMMEHA